MTTQKYPRLAATYSRFRNFDVITQTLEHYYPELFNLAILEQAKKHEGDLKGSYVGFFDILMQTLDDLYTPEEICRVVNKNLQTNLRLRQCFYESLIFVPSVDGIASPQIGFLEKIATGSVRIVEPLTHLDMLRSTYMLQKMKTLLLPRRNDNPSQIITSSVGVVGLATVHISETAQLLTNRALVINFSLNPSEVAKWGVLDCQEEDAITLYCETPLLVSEMQAFEEKFRMPCPMIIGGKANNPASSGYSALAWLDQNVIHAWNFDANADFNTLLSNFVFISFAGDDNGVHFTCKLDEYSRYFTLALKTINKHIYNTQLKHKVPQANKETWGGLYTSIWVDMTMLGIVENKEIEMNDLTKIISLISNNLIGDNEKLQLYTHRAFRSNIPGLVQTLSVFGTPALLVEEKNITHLSVPENLSYEKLNSAHTEQCARTNTNEDLFKYIRRTEKNPTSADEDAATGLVLTMFRAKAKKAKLNIHLPQKFQLNDNELAFIINLMQDNAYVTQLTVNNNQSLGVLKKDLLPVFARNRWLAANNYLPPMIDNYWQRAVNYWLIYLNEHSDVTNNSDEHTHFYNCVEEMGLTGLQKVLASLRNEQQQEFLDRLFGKNKPAFYLACQPHEASSYYEAIIRHLRQKEFFPFSELSISYSKDCETQFINLLESIKDHPQFERLQFTDCIKNIKNLTGFLTLLLKKAQDQQWTAFIALPELEEGKNTRSDQQDLYRLYSHLNNVITKNRHHILAEKLVQEIIQADPLPENSEACDQQIDLLKENQKEKLNKETVSRAMTQLQSMQENIWPLHRSGTVQLQLQQQQEIQQSRQVAVEQHKVRINYAEEILTGEQVTYQTIDQLLGNYYRHYKMKYGLNPDSIPVKEDEESELQAFFRTWISANPTVTAPHLIYSMTIPAAKMLLRNHQKMISGINQDNSGSGFYTQQDKEKRVVLRYNPELGSINPDNPLTLQLNHLTKPAVVWQGYFRFFDLQRYQNVNKALTVDDLRLMALFAKLQPPTQGNETAFKLFCQANPQMTKLFKKNQSLIQKHWPLFMQAWHYQGEKAVIMLLKQTLENLYPSVEKSLGILLKNQSTAIKNQAKELITNKKTLRAFAQIYHQHGEKTCALLLNKFSQIKNNLGHEFFTAFFGKILSKTDNFTLYTNLEFFITINDMINTLLQSEKRGNTCRNWTRFAKSCSTVITLLALRTFRR